MKKVRSEVNPYVELMYSEFKDWSFDDSVVENRGHWREKIFHCPKEVPVDLEIGTGNGTHFAKIAERHPERRFVGLELKFKTLVQSIRRPLAQGSTNVRMARFRAENIKEVFAENEVNNVYIHFPDPWPKRRHNKNRLIQTDFLLNLHHVMKPGCFMEFKTDDWGYFQWATTYFRSSPFTIQFYSEDLHRSFRKDLNFVTHFESLFLKRQQPIFYCRLQA